MSNSLAFTCIGGPIHGLTMLLTNSTVGQRVAVPHRLQGVSPASSDNEFYELRILEFRGERRDIPRESTFLVHTSLIDGVGFAPWTREIAANELARRKHDHDSLVFIKASVIRHFPELFGVLGDQLADHGIPEGTFIQEVLAGLRDEPENIREAGRDPRGMIRDADDELVEDCCWANLRTGRCIVLDGNKRKKIVDRPAPLSWEPFTEISGSMADTRRA